MMVEIKLDDLTDPRIADFLADHIKDMRSVSPPESKHALDLEGLKKPEIAFWSAWSGEVLVGCVAIKRLDAEHAELKSMRTAPSHRCQGVGAWMLNFSMEEARRRGYRRLSLETGSMPFFVPARLLYAKHGFKPCPPFGSYKEDPNSAFMTREL
jgi:putative acetyltransferase